MIKKFGVTLTLVVEADVEDDNVEAAMDALADDLTQTLSEYEVGTASVFPLPDDEPEPSNDAAIIPFRRRKN